MKTDRDYHEKDENDNNDSILNNITKYDNSLQRLFNTINKYNNETSQCVPYCDNLNTKIKKEFNDLREIVNDKINFILNQYAIQGDKLKNEQLSLKNEIIVLQKENEMMLTKIGDLKAKIAKMERMIGHDLKEKDDIKFKTK